MNSMVVLLFVLVAKWENIWSAPVPLRVVDLVHVFDNTTLSFPLVRRFESSNLTVEVPGVSVRVEEYASSTHAGTHIDAPCHFAPGVETVTEIPFYRLIAHAAVVDIRDKVAFNTEYELQIEDLLEWEQTTGHLLNDVILLVRSGWSKYWSNRAAYMGNSNNDVNDLHFPGLALSTVSWLVNNRNVYGVGLEPVTVNPDMDTNTAGHVLLNGNSIYILENMNNMDELPLFGATLHVVPMNMGGACGAPTRILATFPDTSYGSKISKPSYRRRNHLLK